MTPCFAQPLQPLRSTESFRSSLVSAERLCCIDQRVVTARLSPTCSFSLQPQWSGDRYRVFLQQRLSLRSIFRVPSSDSETHTNPWRMANTDLIEFDGVVKDVYPGGNFLVQLDDTGDEVKAHLAGKLRRFRIKILLGDRVRVAVSPYDLSKGRIVFRSK
mmetsp:Transcript_17853/g.29334  ORF Transcript_17853/g.29334 Transcript_17853/m.29334 type:complete len:160 (+) Transcript_17853:83-562(+)